MEEHAARAGFGVKRVHPLETHYTSTLDTWAAALQTNENKSVAVQSRDTYDRYLKYLTGCAELFRDGYTEVCQFTLAKG